MKNKVKYVMVNSLGLIILMCSSLFSFCDEDKPDTTVVEENGNTNENGDNGGNGNRGTHLIPQ